MKNQRKYQETENKKYKRHLPFMTDAFTCTKMSTGIIHKPRLYHGSFSYLRKRSGIRSRLMMLNQLLSAAAFFFFFNIPFIRFFTAAYIKHVITVIGTTVTKYIIILLVTDSIP